VYTLYTSITAANIVLVLIVLYYVVLAYREVKSNFTLGLIVFSLALLVNTLFRCPFISKFITYKGGICVYTPLDIISASFEFVALLVLIYLVRE